MKNTFTILMLTVSAYLCFGQQPAQYSMYNFNKFAFNPAYAGLDHSLSLTGAYRSQWVGLPGRPLTQHLNAHMPTYITGGGAGISMENETLGSWRQTSLSASYAHHMPMDNSGVLSLGLSAGWVQRQLDGSKVRTPSTKVDDLGNIIHNDNSITAGTQSGAGPTAGFGAFFQGDRLEIGVSAANLLGNKFSLSQAAFRLERTYYLYAGYRLELTQSLIATPSILLKSDAQQTQVDFSIVARHNENIFVGASLRGYHTNSLDAVALMGGFKLTENITVGYAYDLGLSALRTVNTGSHEVMLNYNFGKPIGKGRPPVIIYNPRSL